jgi:hypothetical protein
VPVAAGPAPKITRRWKARNELRILRRDGLVRYLRGRRSLRRFHKSVAKL